MDQVMNENYGPHMDKLLYEKPMVVLDGLYREVMTANGVSLNAETAKEISMGAHWTGVKQSWPSYKIIEGSTTPNEVIKLGKGFYQRQPTFDAAESLSDRAVWVKETRAGAVKSLGILTSKESSIVLRGSLMDFTPRDPQTKLEYSLNFSGWTKVTPYNDFGQFELGPISLSEGQNIVAFRASNRAGYASNQLLKILKTGISLQPVLDETYPQPDSILNTKDTV